jgi:hypothetical protein
MLVRGRTGGKRDIDDARGLHAVAGIDHRRPARGHPGAGTAAPAGRGRARPRPGHGRRPGPGGAVPGHRRARAPRRRGGRPLCHRDRPQPGHLPGQGGGAGPAAPAAPGRPQRARAARGRRPAERGGGRGRGRPGRAARPRAGGGGGPRGRRGRHRHTGRGQELDPGCGRGPAGQDAGPAAPRLPAGLRRVELPTARCQPVLLALSAGDRRRQLALDAGGHLMQCPTCNARPARR